MQIASIACHPKMPCLAALLAAAVALAGEQQPANQDGGADPAILRTAQMTGGQAFPPSPDEMEKVGEILALLATANDGDVLSVHEALDGAPKTWTFPVDGSFENLVVSVVGMREVTLAGPDGKALAAAPGVKILELRKGAKVYGIERPQAGAWTLRASGKGKLSLRVLGKSFVFLTKFEAVREGGRPGHEGLFPIQGAPIRGDEVQVRASLSEGISEATFELRALNGQVLARPNMTAERGQEEYTGRVQVPAQPFLVYVLGKDAKGQAVQRCDPFVQLPATVEITAPRRLAVAPASPAHIVIQVVNRGAGGAFKVTACDSMATPCQAKPESLKLARGESKEVDLSWTPPSAERSFGTPNLLISVERIGEMDDQNCAIVELEQKR